MTQFELALRSHLPRPVADVAFADALLSRVLTSASDTGSVDDEPRRRLPHVGYVGGALAGAAIAIGAAIGWRRSRTGHAA